MSEDYDPSVGSLELLVENRRQEQTAEQEMLERAEAARGLADEARLALASLAEPACRVIAARLMGAPAEGGQGALKAGEFPLDENGRPVTKEREDTAWEILARIGVPRLRATAVAASMAAATRAPAPNSPGWVSPELEGEDVEDSEDSKVTPSEIDSQIAAFLEGARAQRDLGG